MNVDVFATLGEKWLGQFVILISPQQIKTWSDWSQMVGTGGPSRDKRGIGGLASIPRLGTLLTSEGGYQHDKCHSIRSLHLPFLIKTRLVNNLISSYHPMRPLASALYHWTHDNSRSRDWCCWGIKEFSRPPRRWVAGDRGRPFTATSQSTRP